jgi:hypothetical protein
MDFLAGLRFGAARKVGLRACLVTLVRFGWAVELLEAWGAGRLVECPGIIALGLSQQIQGSDQDFRILTKSTQAANFQN